MSHANTPEDLNTARLTHPELTAASRQLPCPKREGGELTEQELEAIAGGGKGGGTSVRIFNVFNVFRRRRS